MKYILTITQPDISTTLNVALGLGLESSAWPCKFESLLPYYTRAACKFVVLFLIEYLAIALMPVNVVKYNKVYKII